jgi:hypothetical protein
MKPVKFKCLLCPGTEFQESWDARITYFKKYGSHYEMRIESRSGILVLFGKTMMGYFACIPDFEAGCHLANLRDTFWNSEQLCRTLGEIDGITVARALYAIADMVDSKPKCRNRRLVI